MENKQVGTPTIKTMRDLLLAILEGFKIETEINGVWWTELQGVQINNTNQLDEPLIFKARVAVKKRYCNGVELDECINEPLGNGEEYYIANPLVPKYRSNSIWRGEDSDLRFKDRGVAYLKEESAIKHAKAMLKMDKTTARLKDWADPKWNNADLDSDYMRGYIDATIDVSDILEGRQ